MVGAVGIELRPLPCEGSAHRNRPLVAHLRHVVTGNARFQTRSGCAGAAIGPELRVRRLAQPQPARDVDRLPLHVGRLLGGEERGDARHVVRLAEPSERNSRDALLGARQRMALSSASARSRMPVSTIAPGQMALTLMCPDASPSARPCRASPNWRTSSRRWSMVTSAGCRPRPGKCSDAAGISREAPDLGARL